MTGVINRFEYSKSDKCITAFYAEEFGNKPAETLKFQANNAYKFTLYYPVEENHGLQRRQHTKGGLDPIATVMEFKENGWDNYHRMTEINNFYDFIEASVKEINNAEEEISYEMDAKHPSRYTLLGLNGYLESNVYNISIRYDKTEDNIASTIIEKQDRTVLTTEKFVIRNSLPFLKHITLSSDGEKQKSNMRKLYDTASLMGKLPYWCYFENRKASLLDDHQNELNEKFKANFESLPFFNPVIEEMIKKADKKTIKKDLNAVFNSFKKETLESLTLPGDKTTAKNLLDLYGERFRRKTGKNYKNPFDVDPSYEIVKKSKEKIIALSL